MKKIILAMAASILQALCFAADVRVIKDCKIYDSDYYLKGTLKKDTIAKLWDCSMQDERNNSKLDFDYSICLNIDGQKRLTDASAVIPAETEELFDEEKTTIKLNESYKRWINKDSCDLLYSEDRENFYKENQQEIDWHESRRGLYDEIWYDDSYFYGCPEVSFYNLFINMFDNDYYFSAYVLHISSIKNGYLVKLEIENKGEINKVNRGFDSLYSLLPNIIDQFELRIVFDGDFMYVYHVNGTLMFTNVIVDDSFCNEYESLIRTNKCDLSKVNWPRHADGSCDYDANGNATAVASGILDTSAEKAVVSKSAPAMGKTATVTENLRLRTDDRATAEVVATLATGTRVKVLAPGREDTIDGIASNWVQVEVLDGAKDKDGNAIEAGTIGWLFGGYLSETESAESENPNEESSANENAALLIVPIAAGVAAFAILLAVILFAVKKRKASKD